MMRQWMQYWAFYNKSRAAVALAVAVSLLEMSAVVPAPILVRSLFDEGIRNGQAGQIARIVALIAVLRVLASGLAVYNRKVSLDVTKSAVQRMRRRLYEKLYSLPYSTMKTREVSRLHGTVVDETERVDIMSNVLLSLFLPACIASLGLGVVLVVLSPRLSLIMAIASPVIFVVHRLSSGRLVVVTDRFRKSFEQFSRGALFVIRSMELTRSVGAERWELKRQDAALSNLRVSSASMSLSHGAYASVQTLVVSLSMLAVLGVGAVAIARGTMTIGTLASFYVAAALFAGVTNTIWSTLPRILGGSRSLAAIMDLLDMSDEIDHAGTTTIYLTTGVNLDKVSFSYGPLRILRDVSLAIERGEIVGLYGPNGSGKTTIVRLLLGWERPESGALYADGAPYATVDMTSLISCIGILPQDPVIFEGSVTENIAYGRSESPDAVRRAAQQAGALELIESLPHGFDTVVGENGRLLSGGQRQRIALARALLGAPAFLILDEPGNHLDVDSVRALLRMLRESPERPAVLFISHAAEMLNEVDRAYHLEDGVLAALELKRGNGSDIIGLRPRAPSDVEADGAHAREGKEAPARR